MDLLPEIENRRSLRALSDRPVPPDALERVAAAGTLAPSCYNNQPWRVVVAEGESLAALKAALPEGNAWATRAQAMAAITVRESDDCRLDDGREYALFDAGLCAMAMMLQATREGLVCHPIAGYNPKKAKAALGVPADRVLIVLLVVGYHGDPAGEDGALLAPWQRTAEDAPRARKPLAETVYAGRFQP